MSSIICRLVVLVAVVAGVSVATVANAKTWSIEERQQQLMQDINNGQKLKQLTDKEAKKLREQLSDVARKKKKFQNGDSQKSDFSDSQKSELEADLNTVSTDIKKFELDKRVQK